MNMVADSFVAIDRLHDVPRKIARMRSREANAAHAGIPAAARSNSENFNLCGEGSE